MDLRHLVDKHPRVFHVTSTGSLASIERFGLLSTERLLDLFEVDDSLRTRLLTQPRAATHLLTGDGLPPALIRDQKPMKFVDRKIEPGHTREDFLRAINSRVFFWPSRERLERLRSAKEYRGQEQVVLHVDTAVLVERHLSRIELCRFNSGAIMHTNHPTRGRESWVPVAAYPYEQHRSRYGRFGAVAEVTVLDAVPDVMEMTVEVERVSAG